jgi:cyanophycinase
MTNVDNDQSRYAAPNGRLFIIGCSNNDIPEEAILAHFIDLVGEQARIEVIVADEFTEGFENYERSFKGMGAAHVGRINANESLTADTIARINQAHAVLITGPNQGELFEMLRQRYTAEGLTIAGTNGAALEQFTTGFKGAVNIFIDTECADSGPFTLISGRLRDGEAAIGICVEENAACVIEAGRNAEVVGTGIVYLLDGSGASNTPNILAHNLRVDILSRGQSFKIPPQ